MKCSYSKSFSVSLKETGLTNKQLTELANSISQIISDVGHPELIVQWRNILSEGHNPDGVNGLMMVVDTSK